MPSQEKYKIWWDEKEQIVRAQAFGELDEQASLGILAATKNLGSD